MTRRQRLGFSSPAGGIGNGHKHLGKPLALAPQRTLRPGHLLCSGLQNLPGWRAVPKSIPGAQRNELWCGRARKSCGHVQLQLKPF